MLDTKWNKLTMKDRMHVPDCDVHSDRICDWNVVLVVAT